jgi:hypothetical protein
MNSRKIVELTNVGVCKVDGALDEDEGERVRELLTHSVNLIGSFRAKGVREIFINYFVAMEFKKGVCCHGI